MESSSQEQRCLALNNLGATFIRNGNYEKAIGSLCDSIASMKRILREQAKTNKQSTNNKKVAEHDDEVVQQWFNDCIMNYQSKQQDDSSTSSSSSTATNDASFGYICQHPISIPEDSTQPTRIHSIVAMYNLALSHHLKAHQTNNDFIDDMNLQKAGTLYELCYEMIQVEEIDAGPFFMMAIANNIGQIHAVRGADEQAALFFEHLLQTQMFLVDCGDVEHAPAIMDGYWRNTSRLVLSNCSAAAA